MQKTKSLERKDRELIEIAQKQIKQSYREGLTSMAAVLLTKSGKMYAGVNVKYKKVWKCICAERVAIANAVAAGETDFAAIVTVKYFPEDDHYEVVNMCGECRQVSIFHPGLKVLSVEKDTVVSVPIGKVFPFAYS